jgi:hypothetical protein
VGEEAASLLWERGVAVMQGWRSLLLETGLRVRRSPSSPLFRVADRVCERGAAAGSLMTGGRDDWSWLVCGRCC